VVLTVRTGAVELKPHIFYKMHLRCFISFLLVLIVFHFSFANTQNLQDKSDHEIMLISQWTHELFLDRNVTISWNSSDSEWLVMEMSAPISGYISIGFSPNGGMPGSDIVMGWVDSSGVPKLLVSLQ
jgi:hypothetical protein